MTLRRLLLTADAVGGVWQYATDLARALVPQGYETLLALVGPSPSDEQRRSALAIPGLDLLDTGLALDWLAETPDEVEHASRRLARLAGEHRADLVQLHTPALALARFDMPVIAMIHSCVGTWWRSVRGGPLPDDLEWRADLVTEGLSRADRLVAPTAAFAEDIRRFYGLPEPPHVVHNGRALPALRPRAPHDCIFTAGRLWDPGKDVALLDRVAARLGIPFKAAGPTTGPHGEHIDLLHLHPLGRIGERAVAEQLASRPIFVSAARYEPFGLAVLEAAHAGCPLILSDIPTFRELWDDAATFVAPGDDAGFVRAIEDLVGDMRARVTAGEQSRERAGRYGTSAMAEAMAGHYRALLGPSARFLLPRAAA